MPFPHIYPDPESRRLRAALAEFLAFCSGSFFLAVLFGGLVFRV